MSLRTRRYREAEHLAGLLDGAFSDAWARAVSETSMGGDLNASLRGLMNGMIAADVTRRLHATGKPLFTGEDLDFFRRTREHARRCINTGAPSPMTAKAVDWLARRHDLTDSADRRFAEVAVWEAFIKATEAMEAMILGERPIAFTEPEPPPAPPLVVEMVAPSAPLTLPPVVEMVAPPAPVVAALPPAMPLMSELAELPEGSKEERAPFFHHRATVADATEGVMNQERGFLRRFREVNGDRPVDGYGRADIKRYLDHVRRLPVHWGQVHRNKHRTFAEIIAEADEAGAERVKEKTAKKHLSALSQFFWFAMDAGHITEAEWRNLVGKHAFRAGKAARDQRDGWQPDELVRLFGSPVWTGCDLKCRSRKGTAIKKDWRFWLPLLELFHGARLEEFADLRRRDFECDNGTWFFRIEEGEDRRKDKRGPDGRRSQDRRLKNKAAPRVVPLHPELVRLGFPQHVAEAAPRPDDPLFPDLAPQGRDGKRGPRATRWFVNYRKRIGVFRAGVAAQAFRHTANTRLRDAMRDEPQERHINFIFGHTAAGGGEGAVRYDKGPGLAAAAATLALLRFPELDLSRLYVRG